MHIKATIIPHLHEYIMLTFIVEPGQRKKKIARFGFTTSRGPSSPESKLCFWIAFINLV